ncbi:transcriptional regulator [Actinoplanes ianthinogenes]|uniref:Transcriptional regulator n=1 Tax=Actinoplanes ianthinogenes TaxID=122358 RepID=A0ABM7M763_9ACTN|nr:DUF5753 domain-containing protein [Actinoplanes ianthinogenes]BCJ47428.1 transcriptional regulator [Actinoplanes ianthinogenes]GGR01723.1 transcriptional regulator [Actinoplanes ianthinogenes]
MTASADPTDPRLVLRRKLTSAREASGRTLEQVAAAFGWTVIDLLLVEAVEDGIDTGRLDALADYWGISAGGEIEAVRALPRRDIQLSQELRILFAYETVAAAIDTFEPFVVPGLLQTEAYAEVVLGFYVASGDLAAHVHTRLARQSLLAREDAPEMRFLIDESALCRWSGAGSAVMREQLVHLREAARNPRVRIQVIPLSSGPHEGMRGSFVAVDLATAEPGKLVYLEDENGDVVRVGPAQAAPYGDRFERLADLAAPARDLDAFLDRALARLDGVPES